MHWPTNDGWMYPVPNTYWQPKYARNYYDRFVLVVAQQIIGCVTITKPDGSPAINMPWEDFFFRYEPVPEDELLRYLSIPSSCPQCLNMHSPNIECID